MSIAPITGWLLDRSAEIDKSFAGFCGHVIRASNERRQIIAFYLARDRCGDGRTSDQEIGSFLASARHDAVLVAACGTAIPGLRSVLRRMGPQAYRRKFYTYLHGVLISPQRADFARAMLSLTKIDPAWLQILRALRPELRRATMVAALNDVRDARDLSRLTVLLAEAGADEGAMLDALGKIETRSAVAGFAKRWSRRVELPPHPVPATEYYLPVRHGEELERMARKYRNCARNYLTNALESRSAFSEFHHPCGRAVVHLVRDRGEWRLDRCFGLSNGAVQPDVKRAVRAYLALHGVRERERRHECDRKWEPLRRLAGHFDFEEDE